ncbi:MAG: methylated-DNA-[protein]-cysteine S-methyltransferase [Actinomycetota bacterium]|jgi:methylated-DNA-[protein]-cysteine S-methyltransferase|nr:methylated-DNA-[protein]-cysteine S-methyltransferase [Actinomycetota bacterium]
MTGIEDRLRTAVPDIDLARLARDEGLLDVAVAHVDSPIGDLLLASTPLGLVRVSFFGHDDTLADLAARISPRILESPSALDPVRRQLDEYFDGRRQRFDLTIDWALVGEWGRKVLAACAQIPFGEVSTYGAVAAVAGSPKAFRAAGTALGHNPVPVVVPCHRVLAAGGKLGGYTGGTHIKEHLLRLEGALLA